VGERRWYALDRDITDREEARVACSAVLGVLGPVIAAAHVDVYSDYRDEMPEAVRRAEEELAEAGRRRRRRSGNERIDVVVNSHDSEWSALEVCASWSINVDLEDMDGRDLGTFHDCGYSIVASLDDEEVGALRARASEVAPVVPLEGVHARRRQARGDRRRERLRRQFGRPRGV
jgi:hypothetical protein